MSYRTPPSSSRRVPSQQQQQFHSHNTNVSFTNTATTHAPSAADLQKELRYTQDVLKRYKTYVDDKLQGQLDEYAATCEELGSECNRLRDTNVLLHNRLEVAQAAAEKFRTEAMDAHDAVDAERLRLENEHSTMQAEIEHRTRLAVDASGQLAEELGAVQSALSKRDQEIRRLRVALAEREGALAATPVQTSSGGIMPQSSPVQRTPGSLGPAAGSTLAVCQSVQGITSSGLDFANILAAACAHINIDCSGSIAAWKALQQKVVTPDGLAECVSELAAVERSQQTAVAQALKAFVLRQAELLDSLAAREQAHHTDKELMKRRLEEVERDHKAERDAAVLRAEKERLRVGVGISSNVVAQRGIGGGPSAASSGAGYAWGASSVDELVMAAAAGEGTRVESVATQTNLADVGQQSAAQLAAASGSRGKNSINSNGDNSAVAASERLFAEVKRLQDESAVHKSTILMLEQQRRTFLGFVDNDRISAHVKAALSGSLTDSVRRAAGLSY